MERPQAFGCRLCPGQAGEPQSAPLGRSLKRVREREREMVNQTHANILTFLQRAIRHNFVLAWSRDPIHLLGGRGRSGGGRRDTRWEGGGNRVRWIISPSTRLHTRNWKCDESTVSVAMNIVTDLELWLVGGREWVSAQRRVWLAV